MNIKPENYVVDTNIGSEPRISLNLAYATPSEVNEAISAYTSAAEEYANNVTIIFTNKEYVADRLMKDLCRETYLVSGEDANLSENTITLHTKANNVYELAVGDRDTTNATIVNSISSDFNLIYSSVCLNDASESTSLVEDFNELTKYDNQAVSIDVNNNQWGGTYIKNVPNAIGNSQTFTSYDESNQPKYTLAYLQNYQIDDSTNSVWMISSGSTNVAYTTATLEQRVDSGLIVNEFEEGATWTEISE